MAVRVSWRRVRSGQNSELKMPHVRPPVGEGRKLTAAWLNIMAAGIVSAGTAPVVTAITLEGWSERTRSLVLLPPISFLCGAMLHAIGRFAVRESRHRGVGSKPPLAIRAKPNLQEFPTEQRVDDVIAEHGGDPRTALKAVLHDLDQFASDRNEQGGSAAVGAPHARRRA